MGAIFLLNSSNELVEMHDTPYDAEAVLQELLARYPSLLTGDLGSEEEPSRWLLIKREMPVASEGGSSGTWSVDHLFVDQQGVPTLVEVKQSRNSEIRRSVVGQLLDYGANAVLYWPIERLRATFENSVVPDGSTPEDRLAALIGRDQSPDAFWQVVATNLQAQRIRLIFVADEIPPELRRVIEFLNRQMSPAEVLGIEVRQFSGKGQRTLVPQVIGRTADAEARKGQQSTLRRDDWNWEAYEEELRVPKARIEIARAVESAVRDYITAENVPWRLVARKGYVAILRAGDYKVGVIDVYWRKAPRFAVKLPDPPSDLGLASPYPKLVDDWDPSEKEWGWTLPNLESIPDVTLALNLVKSFQPPTGPMVALSQQLPRQ